MRQTDVVRTHGHGRHLLRGKGNPQSGRLGVCGKGSVIIAAAIAQSAPAAVKRQQRHKIALRDDFGAQRLHRSEPPGYKFFARRPAAKHERQAAARCDRQGDGMPSGSKAKEQRADVNFSGQRPKPGHDRARRRTKLGYYMMGQLLAPGRVTPFPLLQGDTAGCLLCHI